VKDEVDEDPGKDNTANQNSDLDAYQDVAAFVDYGKINVGLLDSQAHIKSLIQGTCASTQGVLCNQVHGSSDQV
jgi:hypothetical protein